MKYEILDKTAVKDPKYTLSTLDTAVRFLKADQTLKIQAENPAQTATGLKSYLASFNVRIVEGTECVYVEKIYTRTKTAMAARTRVRKQRNHRALQQKVLALAKKEGDTHFTVSKREFGHRGAARAYAFASNLSRRKGVNISVSASKKLRGIRFTVTGIKH